MGKGLGRHLTQCALTDTRKDRVAQLLEPVRHHARQPIDHRQGHRAERKQPGGAVTLSGEGINGCLVKKRRANGDQLAQQQDRQ